MIIIHLYFNTLPFPCFLIYKLWAAHQEFNLIFLLICGSFATGINSKCLQCSTILRWPCLDRLFAERLFESVFSGQGADASIQARFVWTVLTWYVVYPCRCKKPIKYLKLWVYVSKCGGGAFTSHWLPHLALPLASVNTLKLDTHHFNLSCF